MQGLGSLKSFPWYALQLSRASILLFSIPSGCTTGGGCSGCWLAGSNSLCSLIRRVTFFVHICPCTRAVISVGQIPTTGVPGSKDLCILKWFWSTLDIILIGTDIKSGLFCEGGTKLLVPFFYVGSGSRLPTSLTAPHWAFHHQKVPPAMSLHCCPPTSPTPAFDIQYHSKNLVLLDILTFLNCNHCQKGLVHWMF